ncbi:unnamed protein product, partial [Brenthis ino]
MVSLLTVTSGKHAELIVTKIKCCDRENCTEGEEHTHQKSGRKTPIKRSTPIKQVPPIKKTVQTVPEIEEVEPPPHRTRHSSRQAEKLIKTSDYSSEESLDRLKGHKKEIYQNEVNSQYERVSTSNQQYSTLTDVTFSPILLTHNVTRNSRSSRFSSPAYSACSTDSSFAEQALADASLLLEREPTTEHLPSRLYKMAEEYWNKYPKTDYTYSHLSRDRVELAPGLVAMPNMSRRPLSQARSLSGPVDEPDIAAKSVWQTSSLRKRFTSIDSSDDEGAYVRNGFTKTDERWWITRLIATVLTTITTSASNAYRKVVGPSHRYPYTDRRPAKSSIVSRTASAAATPFYWLYTVIKTIVTTTVTTITETISSSEVNESGKYARRYSENAVAKRRWWPWMLLFLLPTLGYGSYYTYENYEHLVMPNFTDFHLDLTEFSAKLPNLVPNITLPKLNLTLPDINITLPDITDNMPRVTHTYRVYKEVVQNRVSEASDYVTIVAESCWEEIRRFWHGVIG